jgi:two-component system, NtrC family, sensor histidine kinase KinB
MENGFQLLLLDDNPDDRLLIWRQLRNVFPDLRVTEVMHDKHFEQVLQNDGFDLVITDYQLRWTDGLSVLRAVKDRWPDCPTVMFTGTGSEEVAVEAMKLGLDDYVLKSPRHYVLLQAAIQSALAKSRQRQALKMAEQRILRLNETMTSILASFPDVVFVIGSDRKIEFSNSAAKQLTRDLHLEGRFPPGIQAVIDRVLRTGSNHLPSTLKDVHRFRIKNEERFFLPRVVAIHGGEHSILGAAMVLQDVTEFRLLDDVKTNLISTVSHELKTPITSVRMAMLVMLEETVGPLTPRQREMLSIAHNESERLLKTLNSLLDLTRFEEGLPDLDITKVDPQSLLEAAVQQTAVAAQDRNLKISVSVADGLPPLEIDEEKISHVLTNLLTNAIKHSPEGAEIILSARLTTDRDVCLGVKDYGPGIAEEYQSRIFDKFFRIPGRPKTGTGLGLAIAKEFVKAHHGNIGVNSQAGQGSEFFVNLPVNRPID